MTASTLSRLLISIEESSGAISIPALAAALDLSPTRVENMVEFWVRKGRIRLSSPLTDCGSCSSQGDCPFILEMPKTFELVCEGGDQMLENFQQPSCK